MRKDLSPVPKFATNWQDPEQSVAEGINRLLSTARIELAVPPQIAIATAYFNAGGFSLIAAELENAPKVRLLLGAEPEREVVADLAPMKEKQEHLNAALKSYSAWLENERDLVGFTPQENLNAQRLVAWLRSLDEDAKPKVEVRRYNKGFLHGKAFIANHPAFSVLLAGSSNFTYAGLMRNAELMIGVKSDEHVQYVLDWFDTFWEDSEPFDLAELYELRWQKHSPWLVFLRMLWERYGNDIGDEKYEQTLLKLAPFQAEGVKRAMRLMDEIGGVLVADEVGLGKTFIAGEIIKQISEQERQRVLILTPAALRDGMWNPFLKKYDFSRKLIEVWSYAELRRKSDPENFESSDQYKEFMESLDQFGLIVVDEAHNLRNESAAQSKALTRLLGGTNPKRVLLLTATPVNNSLSDLETLIKYFVTNDAKFSRYGIPSISRFVKRAQDIDPESLSPKHLFDLMDKVAVRRTRSFVKKFYPNATIENAQGVAEPIVFPEPELYKLNYDLHDAAQELVEAVIYALDMPDSHNFHSHYKTRRDDPNRLMMARYTPSEYDKNNKLEKYQLTNAGLLRSALLKRMESSPVALENTLQVLINSHKVFLDALEDGWVLQGRALQEWGAGQVEQIEEFVEKLGDKAKSQMKSAMEFHAEDLRNDVENDLSILERLFKMSQEARIQADPKVETLIKALTEIAQESEKVSKEGIDPSDRRKVIVFSTYTDTVIDLHRQVEKMIFEAPDGSPLALYKGRIAPAMSGKTSNDEKQAEVIAGFAPDSSNDLLAINKYDILITTDLLSEGINLQQAGQIINYDLPWNPMRIVQRHGRIDRIGSKHRRVYLGLFFPNELLDKLLKLEATIRRKIAYATAAIGNINVMPGQKAVIEVNLADLDEMNDAIDENLADILKLEELDVSILERGGTVSGEEYRKRLFTAIEDNPFLKTQMLRLPYGSGSGFKSNLAGSQGFVFCIKVKREARPWFVFIPTDKSWNHETHENGDALIVTDTLTALTAADPKDDLTPYELPKEAFDAAYSAWNLAQARIFNEWQKMTDINAFKPEVPKAFLDASNLIHKNPANWSPAEASELIARLNVSPSFILRNAVRQILDSEKSDSEKANEIRDVIHEAGLQPTKVAPPLPEASLDEVRLITWMAISN